jgi:Phage endonuclease I
MATRKACYSVRRRHDTGTYRSGLEVALANALADRGINGHYEEYYITYVKPESNHKYTPDFVLPNGIVIESKGVWDSDDRKKHLLIKEQYPELDIRFIFSRSKTPLYKGSKTTYASFCEAHGIKYADKTIPEDWFKEDKRPAGRYLNKHIRKQPK